MSNIHFDLRVIRIEGNILVMDQVTKQMLRKKEAIGSDIPDGLFSSPQCIASSAGTLSVVEVYSLPHFLD